MPKEDQRTLIVAAEEGCIEKIRHLIANGTSPDTLVDGWTALEKASIHNQCDIIKVLIESGADPNRADEDGLTSIHWSAKNGHADALETLIACGARYDDADISGSTPLHCAAESGHKDVVSVLLKRGADPGRACENGNTPLHDACLNGNIEAAKLLLENSGRRNIDIYKKNNDGATPEKLAEMRGHVKIVELLKSENSWRHSLRHFVNTFFNILSSIE